MRIVGDIWQIAREPNVLTQKQLEILELRELHGCTWNQISFMKNLDQSTVRGHYNRARRRLALELERRT